MDKSNKIRVLTALRSAGGYLSGQELCETIGVSRTAIWKIVNQLKDEGYQINSVPNRGYLLMESPDVLGAAEILSRMNTKIMGRNLIYKEETGSTNLDAKAQAEQGAPHGTLVVSDNQTAGRGRRGRTWASPKGCNIYFTLMLRPDCEPNRASMLTLVTALAVCDTVRNLGLDAGIKWPNDVVVNGKKVCGILTEMNAEPDYIHYVVIGTGINVNQTQFPEEIAATAGSLKLEKGETVYRARLLADVMERFELYYEKFAAAGDLSGLQEIYNSMCVNCGRQVKVLDPKGEYIGMAEGINAGGELLVKRQDGTVEEVYAGEVSVRGIYGYV